MCKKELYVVRAAIVIAIAVMMFFPLTGTAGSLEPSAAPAPTMKTLDQIPPTWSQTLPGAQRFELVLDGVAVLDKETGLVWEKSPSNSGSNWNTVIDWCATRQVGGVAGRYGWHLPTVEQLMSLIDRTVAGPPYLPAGHPFTNVPQATFWSATTVASNTANAWIVSFYGGYASSSDKANFANYFWCVRGGQSYDAR